MTFRQKYICIFLLLAGSLAWNSSAQSPLNPNWGAEKIKGVRFTIYSSYMGSPFLNMNWDLGKIEFTDGEILDSLRLRYSSFKDELLYFNSENASQIIIDKPILKNFSFTEENGRFRQFTKLAFPGFQKGDRYFEVLSDGETKLLVYRKVDLISTTPYHDSDHGPLKNMEYREAYQYYFYTPEKGFTPVRLSHAGLMAKFDKVSQKQIKKSLRKNRIKPKDESSFVQAWKVIENKGFQIIF